MTAPHGVSGDRTAMTRIIGGRPAAGGSRRHAGRSTRPTSDRVREALFSAIESWCGSLSRAALPRPVRRVRRGRAGGLVARGRRGHAGRAGPAYRRADLRPTPATSASPGRGAWPARSAGTLAPAARARRTTWCSSTRRTPMPSDDVAADLAALRRPRLAGAGRDGGRRAGSRAAPSRPGRTGFERRAGRRSTARPCSGTFTPPRPSHPPSRTEPQEAPCAEPSAPGRSTRSPTGTSTSSRRASRLFDEVVVAVGVNKSQEPAVHRRGADRRCCSEACADLRQRHASTASTACSRLLRRARHRTRSSRACARSATSTTSCRWRR